MKLTIGLNKKYCFFESRGESNHPSNDHLASWWSHLLQKRCATLLENFVPTSLIREEHVSYGTLNNKMKSICKRGHLVCSCEFLRTQWKVWESFGVLARSRSFVSSIGEVRGVEYSRLFIRQHFECQKENARYGRMTWKEWWQLPPSPLGIVHL